MASLEQRLRGDGGTTARVVWRQDGRRATEKFAVGRNPLLAAKRFKTLVEAAGNRWPEGWVPGLGFVTAVTPDASDSEPTPLLAFGLRYVEQLIIRPGQRARYRAQLKALAVLELPSPTMPGTTYLPFGRNVEDVTPEDDRLWLSRWARGLKTKANYHGLLFGVFAWAVGARTHHRQPLRQDRSITAHHQGGAARADLAHRGRVQDLCPCQNGTRPSRAGPRAT